MELKDLLLERNQCNERITAMREEFENSIKVLGQELNAIEDQIEGIIAGPVKQARQQTGKDTGTVDVLVQGVMVKHNVSKSVKWDQEKLLEVRCRIEAFDDDPNKYMDSKTTYKISEKQWKSFSPVIKKVFTPARSVVPGAAKVSFDTNWR